MSDVSIRQPRTVTIEGWPTHEMAEVLAAVDEALRARGFEPTSTGVTHGHSGIVSASLSFKGTAP